MQVTIVNQPVPVLEHQNKRVITTELLAALYGAEAHNIRQNFKNNSTRFEEGKHFFKLQGQQLRDFKNCVTNSHSVGRVDNIYSVDIAPNVNAFMLWTDRGSARHAKLLDTDQAWEVFEKLEENYFNPPVEVLSDTDRQLIPLVRQVVALFQQPLIQSNLDQPTVSQADGVVQALSYDKVSHQERMFLIRAVARKSGGDASRRVRLRNALFNAFGVPAYVFLRKSDFKPAVQFIEQHNFASEQLGLPGSLGKLLPAFR